MAFACVASQLQYDNHSIADPIRELQAIEVLEQVLLEQMEFNAINHNHVASAAEKNNILGSLFNIHPTSEARSPYTSSERVLKGKRLYKPTTTAEFGQYMEFVDSPPDSKEAWPTDYLKPMMQKSGAIEGDTIVSRSTTPPNMENPLAKKRRMNWDNGLCGDVRNGGIVGVAGGGGGNNEAGAQQPSQELAKDHLQIDRRKARYAGSHVPEIQSGVGQAAIVAVAPSGPASDQQQQTAGAGTGNAPNSNNHGNAGAGGAWGDDIDFDLNNDLSSNGYMNEALFYHSLGAFKQEVPSPSDKSLNQQKLQQQNAGNGNELMAKRNVSIINGDGNRSPVEMPAQQNMGSPEPGSNVAPNIMHPLQNHPSHQQQQQLCHIQQPTNNAANNNTSNGINVIANHMSNDNVVSFQQLLQENNNYNEKMGNGTGAVGGGRVITPPLLDKSANSTSYINDDTRFQYVLAAATSIATKNNEDTLTYLNQGQSYEIKLKKLGDLTNFRNKILTSVIKICFYERRLQYMEREQMQQWQATRPGERILEIDVPLSYGCHPSQPANPNQLNAVEVMWDPMKEVGVYIRVNCISTEFTPKKHGGEKGVPFRIQVETYLDNKPVHGAMCQIKVFKLKGADRKHKQDREKIQKRSISEQEKYQPSYECTILNDLPMDQLQQQPGNGNPIAMSPSDHIPAAIHSPSGNKFDPPALFAYNHQNSNSDSSSNSLGVLNRQGSTSNPNLCKTLELVPSPPASLPTKDFFQMKDIQLTKDTTPQQLAQWLNYYRLSNHQSTFAHFSGADLLRLNKDDLIQICGLADGIRLFNIVHKKAITPRLTIFVSFDGSYYNAIYLYTNKLMELMEKVQNLPGFKQHYAKKQTKLEGQVNGALFLWEMQQNNAKLLDESMDSGDFEMLLHLPSSGIQVMMTEDVVSHIKDESLYLIVIENRRVILRPVVKE